MPKRRKTVFSATKVRAAVACKTCDAAAGECCWNDNGVQALWCHWQRHADYERKCGRRAPRGARGMTVRFVCPVCGGDHARAEHPA